MTPESVTEALTPWLDGASVLLLAAAGVFTRIGAALFLLPGIGERAVPVRVRLGAALAICMVMSPMIAPMVPGVPEGAAGIGLILLAEAIAGLIIGFAFRMLVYILQIAGMVASQSLSIAQMFGSGVAPEPEPTIATFLSIGGIALMLSAGLHVEFIAALSGFYDVLPFGRFPAGGEAAEWSVSRVAAGFRIALALAAPFLVIGFVYNLSLGALNRAMPQLMVSFVGVPAIVWLGILALAVTAPSIFAAWGRTLGEVFANPLWGLR